MDSPDDQSPSLTGPSITLPKGGGAIRGIGETFTTNVATGTGRFSVPLATSAGRSGFGPQLSLTYDSGAGNGPFGFGWSLSTPAITRKTERGLPRYVDGAESDVFLLSGAEDLVPLLNPDGTRFQDPGTPGYTVHRYRPRIEGLFAQIERWVAADGETHWRSISRDNVLTVYGATDDSRISQDGRVFSWLICETRDDKGNAVVYRYLPEDERGVDLTRPHERHRHRTANRYLKSIRYGNRVPLLDVSGRRPAAVPAATIEAADWMFEVVFDYGDGHLTGDTTDAEGRRWVTASVESTRAWDRRADAFSSYRAGFEVRTARLCRRVLMFHHFPGEPDVGSDCLVRSTDFGYASDPAHTFLATVTQHGYRRVGDRFLSRALPSIEFSYTRPEIRGEVEEADPESLRNLPAGFADPAHQWVDLHGEGVPGILAEQAGAWFYRRNLSPLGDGEVTFAPLELVASRPNADTGSSTGTSTGAQFLDLAGDGTLDLVVFEGATPGFYEHDEAEGWQPFRSFPSTLHRRISDPAARFVDLDGDGRSDVLIAEDDALVWHRSRGEDGFDPARRLPRLPDLGGPAGTIHLADMSGDGLTDLVRIRNGEVCYWPNLGHGRFGDPVTMDRSPVFDDPDQYDPERLRLADIDGTGTVDLIYLHRDGVRLYFNEAGNGWSDAHVLPVFPAVDDLATITATDLLGNGTACLVWSSPLPGDAGRPLRFVRLMGDGKPHLLVAAVNNLGAETRVRYVPSTRFYLQDKRDGRPWVTRLPFPVHVVDRVETYDRVAGNRFVTRYAYRDGYFDGEEREFRGFGMVEQWDTDEDDLTPPVLTRTWFHTGGPDLAGCVLPAGLDAGEEREARRALKGVMLRQEVYGCDGTPAAVHPYAVTEQTFTVEARQRRGDDNRHAVFFTHARESRTTHQERNPDDPRVSHTMTLAVNEFGNVLRSLSVGYGRRSGRGPLAGDDADRQETSLATYTVTDYTEPDSSGPDPSDWTGAHRTPLPYDVRTYEVTGLAGVVPFEDPDPSAIRLVERVRTRYLRDDLGGLLPEGRHAPLGLPGESYRLAFTADLLASVYPQADQLSPAGGGYVDLDGDGNWWLPSGRVFYAPNAPGGPDAAGELAYARQHFFLPHRHRDPFGQTTVTGYDGHDLLPVRTEDPLGNVVAAVNDYRVLQPRLVTESNGNRSEVAFDALGRVAGTAVMGKETPAPAEGDSLAAFVSDLTPAETARYRAAQDPRPLAVAHLGTATTRVVYDLDQVPVCVAVITRETHVSALAPGEQAAVQIVFGYSDGFGREMQKKAQAEPGPVPRRDADGAIVLGPDGRPELVDGHGAPRWVGSGWTIYNSKGKPVRVFEPFFSDTHRVDADASIGVSPWLLYDPLGRQVATVHSDHSWEKIVFDPWQRASYDGNDTVLHADGTTDPRNDPDVGGLIGRLPVAVFSPTWYERRMARTVGDPARTAAEQTAVHRQTPAVAHLDALGRPFLTVTTNRFVRDGAEVEQEHAERVELDITGNERAVYDAVPRLVARYEYDLLGNRIYASTMDAGERWLLGDVSGEPWLSWDSRGFTRRVTYDALRRPTGRFVTEAGVTRLAERTVYGESEGAAANHRTRTYQVCDGAGVLTNVAFDFKGNPVEVRRDLLADYRREVDWQADPAADDGSHTTRTGYDALNRPSQVTTPDGTVYRPGFNAGGLLDRVDMRLGGTWTAFVTSIDYDAKGQRERIIYGNGASTTYAYDPETFRLVRMRTTRPAGDGTSAALFVDPTVVQDLRYTYDAVGNITRIEDAALAVVTHDNQRVEPVSGFTYDARYRLVETTGREHVAPDDIAVHLNDLAALRTYRERYDYDPAGNFRSMRHLAGAGSWTRSYEYAPGSNRVTRTVRGNGTTTAETYDYTDAGGVDAAGCITRLNGREMTWDGQNRLRTVDLGGGGTAYYVYDQTGQRVRKVVDDQFGVRRSDRVYVGGYELFRSFGVNAVTRETLHVMDDERRIALVETADGGEPVIRYQFGDHLGSAAVELDPDAALISYEEYHPYGTSSLRAGRGVAEVSLKRYRHTGRERDEETGFSYHSARYYAPWLGRWTSADPQGTAAGLNPYEYCRGRPTMTSDPDGTLDEEAKEVLRRLQQVIDDIPQDEFKGLSRAEQGTRAHLTLESILSIDPKSPARVPGGVRLAPEVIVDTTGKIVAFGEPGQFGKAAKDFRTMDVALLKSPVTDVKDLIGKNASDVVEAAIDYKTGAAKLKGVGDMEDLIKAPYVKAVQGGSVEKAVVDKAAKMSKTALTATEGVGGAVKQETKVLNAAEGLGGAVKSESKALKAAKGLESLKGPAKIAGKRIAMAIPGLDLIAQQVFYEDLGYGLSRTEDAAINLTIAEAWEIPMAVYATAELAAKGLIVGGEAAADAGKGAIEWVSEKTGLSDLERRANYEIGRLYNLW
ncbi:SpvB/TcaC N-terminal domain-containing protein [Micromonospora sp. NPDC005220]|uniref:SpvB/TcaC N-terminal domain-containing protein n=1 Tax=Micromonospora sp. NPDC005220 TaxID=3155589 RepID=UPI0033BC442E